MNRKLLQVFMICEKCGHRTDTTDFARLAATRVDVTQAIDLALDAARMVLDGWGKYDGAFGLYMRRLRQTIASLDKAVEKDTGVRDELNKATP